MSAAIRLFRASLVFSSILASYLLQLALVRVFGEARLRARWGRVHRANAQRLFRAFIRLRGVYIKLGQILSIMGNFLPRVFVKELEGLQDEVPPRPYRAIARSIERCLGRPVQELYGSFEQTAMAAASLGQVHRATTQGGEQVAVKVLYPNVATIIAVDLRVLRWVLVVYGWFVPIKQLSRVHDQLTEMLARETDFVHEARCLERMAGNFDDDPDVVSPRLFPELCGDRVLTMSLMAGVKISHVDELEALGLDPFAVATKLTQVFYKQLFVDRFFHADPHPGNFFVQRGPDGQARLVILDYGAASELPDSLADGMLEVIKGTMTRDDDLVIRGIHTMGFVSPDGDSALLERATRAYFEKLLNLNITNFGKISGEIAQKLRDPGVTRGELRELMKSVEYPHGWLYVERAVVILFGLCASIAPTLNTMRVGFPYLMQFIADANARQAAEAPPAAVIAAPPTTAQPVPSH